MASIKKAGVVFLVGDYPDSPLKGLELRVPDGKLHCSFCQSETSEVMAQRGMVAPRKIVKTERVGNTFEEKVVHVAGKVVACPNCAHHIKPILQSDMGTGSDNCKHKYVRERGTLICSECGREKYIAHQNVKTYSGG